MPRGGQEHGEFAPRAASGSPAPLSQAEQATAAPPPPAEASWLPGVRRRPLNAGPPRRRPGLDGRRASGHLCARAVLEPPGHGPDGRGWAWCWWVRPGPGAGLLEGGKAAVHAQHLRPRSTPDRVTGLPARAKRDLRVVVKGGGPCRGLHRDLARPRARPAPAAMPSCRPEGALAAACDCARRVRRLAGGGRGAAAAAGASAGRRWGAAVREGRGRVS